MDIVYDLAKDLANIAKHGLSLELAAFLSWERALVQQDVRRNYGELRMIGYVPLGDRLFCAVFTDLDNKRRIISLRKANDREVKRYAANN